MRFARTARHKLVHNLNFYSPFPIDQDFYLSASFQDMLQRTREGRPLNWNRTLMSYYERDEWELFDLERDPDETVNLAGDPLYEVREQVGNNMFYLFELILFRISRSMNDISLFKVRGMARKITAASCSPRTSCRPLLRRRWPWRSWAPSS